MADPNILVKQIDWATKQLLAAIMSDNFAGKVTFHFKQKRILQSDTEITLLADSAQDAKSLVDRFSTTAKPDDLITIKKRPDGKYGGSQKRTIKFVDG